MVTRSALIYLSQREGLKEFASRFRPFKKLTTRFVAGETIEEAVEAIKLINADGCTASFDHLNESVTGQAEAEAEVREYLQILKQIDDTGIRSNVSIKLTQLGLDFDLALCQSLASEIASAAAALGRTIEMDMEGSAYANKTLDIFEAAQREHKNVGLAIQAYLFRSEKDIARLAPLRPKIRLVKGAYREPAKIAIQKKSEVDANYRRLASLLFEGAARGDFFPAIATHDPAMLAHVRQEISRLKLARKQYEFQMIYGIRRDLQEEIHASGHALQIYVPFGTDWCPYFMRRLSERPANCWFVLRSLVAESFHPPR